VVSSLIAYLVVAALVVIAVATLLLLVVRNRYRARLAALKGQLKDSPEFLDDRSYNQLRLAKAEAAALAKQGVDTTMANHAIADAESAGRRRDYEGALRSARLAHELLVNMRTRADAGLPPTVPFSVSMNDPGTASTPLNRASAPTPPAAPPLDASAGADPDAPAPRLAKNRAESHFQMGLLREETDRAASARPGDPAVENARGAGASAQQAYDRADYTEALRLALRARRQLGVEIESLPAPTTRIPPTPTSGPTASSAPAGTIPCARCGRPLKGSDRFCRGCGTARAPTACAACGSSLEPGDQFCAGCGATVA
jgi:hypothetical protein